MRKVLSFSAFLVVGLFIAQYLPAWSGSDYGMVKTVSNVLLYICLGFIMINVGREFEVDKSRWQTYAKDYFVAMATAAMPWFLIAIYYIFVLLPPEYWNSWEAWKENLLLSRFAAPTSAGILFTMLAAIGLKSSWIYKKIQVLYECFDDLDTILLMIPLQIMMIGPRWQLLVIILIVFLLLSFGWKKLSKYNMRQDWKAILFYSVLVFAATQSLYLITKNLYGEDASIHIEVLLPAFVLGMVMKHKDIDTVWERKASTGISFIFMFLVGMSMPPLLGISLPGDMGLNSITGSQEMMPWALIIVHVVVVSLLSNVGKLFPVFFYRDRKLSERLALSIGMFTRGEVGAGVIFIALGYNLGGPALVISVLTIVLNLILTGIFVLWVKKLALMSYQE